MNCSVCNQELDPLNVPTCEVNFAGKTFLVYCNVTGKDSNYQICNACRVAISKQGVATL